MRQEAVMKEEGSHPLFIKRASGPFMVSFIFAPVVVLSFLIGEKMAPRPFSSVLFLLGMGLFTWTFFEYFIHITAHLLHRRRIQKPWRTYSSDVHMVHHKSMSDHRLALTPPLAGLFYTVILYFIFLAVTRSQGASLILISGVVFGFLIYEWVHYADHYHVPRTRLGKYLRHYHLQHHLKNPNKTFGVTNPLWDLIFGTYDSSSLK